MRKIILNFRGLGSGENMQEYLKKKMDFPDYYGKNLDALYDCLTDISGPTAVVLCVDGSRSAEKRESDAPPADFSACAEEKGLDALEYEKKICHTFLDAEEDNDNLAVFLVRDGTMVC